MVICPANVHSGSCGRDGQDLGPAAKPLKRKEERGTRTEEVALEFRCAGSPKATSSVLVPRSSSYRGVSAAGLHAIEIPKPSSSPKRSPPANRAANRNDSWRESSRSAPRSKFMEMSLSSSPGQSEQKSRETRGCTYGVTAIAPSSGKRCPTDKPTGTRKRLKSPNAPYRPAVRTRSRGMSAV